MADALRAAFEVDRVSIARIDGEAARFEIVADSGAELLPPGTALPVSTCSYFVEAAQGRSFSAADFDASSAFVLPLDGVVLASGFHSGCAVPIRRAGRAVGAVSLSATARGARTAGTVADVEAIVDALADAVDRPADASASAVLVCHADVLAGRGIARLVERDHSAVVSVAPTVAEAVAAAAARPPDVIICDDWVDGHRVDEVVRRLRAAGVSAPLVVVSSRDTPENLRTSLLAGASAHIARGDVLHALPAALVAVRDGGTALPAPRADDRAHLTQREHELLAVLDEGLRFKQVAIRLGITVATAKTHARNLFRKLDATSRTEALRTARERGLLG